MSYLRFLGLFVCWCSLQQTENFFSRKNDIRGWIARQNSIQLLKRLVLGKRLVKIVFLESTGERKSLEFLHVRKRKSELFRNHLRNQVWLRHSARSRVWLVLTSRSCLIITRGGESDVLSHNSNFTLVMPIEEFIKFKFHNIRLMIILAAARLFYFWTITLFSLLLLRFLDNFPRAKKIICLCCVCGIFRRVLAENRRPKIKVRRTRKYFPENQLFGLFDNLQSKSPQLCVYFWNHV